MDAFQRFTWAMGVLRAAIDNKMYGHITIHMQEGVISSLKKEIIEKPCLDSMPK